MPAVLDIRTLILVYVGIAVGQAVVLVYLWSVQRNYPPARDWALGSLLFAIGLSLFALRNLVSPVLSEIVSNLFLLPGLMLFTFGIARAAGRRPALRLGLAVCVLAIGMLTWFVVGESDYQGGVLMQGLVFLGFYIYVAYTCFTARAEKGNHTFKFLGALYAVLVLACLWRIAGGVFGLTFSLASTLPRLVWVTTSLVTFPMVTVLLTLHTSQRLQEEIHAQARRDTLTDAFNRRAFAEFAAIEWARSVRLACPLSILAVDIDHFKTFNDRHGHLTGDRALVQVSKSAQAALRANDIWCRYGGEEFVALLPNTNATQAQAIAERLRQTVESTAITGSDASGPLTVTISVGAAERLASHAGVAEVLALADAALYKAKAAGRNQVIIHTPTASESGVLM